MIDTIEEEIRLSTEDYLKREIAIDKALGKSLSICGEGEIGKIMDGNVIIS